MPKKPAKKPPPSAPDKEVWRSQACSQGKCSDCNGKLVMIPGPCECKCHLKEEVKPAA